MHRELSSIGAITLFVEDLQGCRTFYERVFAASVIADDEDSAVFDFGGTFVNLLSVGAAEQLTAPGPVAAPEAGSRTQLTIWVEDADATCAELEARGVALSNGPVDREWGKRTASFTDPAGHLWEIAQTLSPADAS